MRPSSERDWIAPVMVLVVLQHAVAMAMAFLDGFFRRPPLIESISIALLYVATAIVALLLTSGLPWKSAIDHRLPRIRAVVIGGGFLALQFSLLTWMKMLLPIWSGGFWADPVLAKIDHNLFGVDPWQLTRLVGGGANIISFAYAGWLFIVPLVLFLLLMSPPSRAKKAAMISAFGITAFCAFSQFFLPSAGPLFFDLAGWGNRYAGIEGPAASAREWLWRFHAEGTVKAGIGISAMPSLHVAFAFWLVLVARPYHWAITAIAAGYFALIFFGSVYLGLHYVADGIAGVIAMAAIFRLASRGRSKSPTKAMDSSLFQV